MIEKFMAVRFALQGSLKKEPPRGRGGGRVPGVSLVAMGGGGLPGEGTPQRLAWRGDTCLCNWKMALPQGQRGSRLLEWARTQETQARCPQVGEVGKRATETVKGAGSLVLGSMLPR